MLEHLAWQDLEKYQEIRNVNFKKTTFKQIQGRGN